MGIHKFFGETIELDKGEKWNWTYKIPVFVLVILPLFFRGKIK